MKKDKLLFLRDVLLFTFTAFGGAQAHLALLLKYFVKGRRYISEEELLEINALAQVLPGPASTQTLVGIAYKVGGLGLSIVTFLIWIIPSAAMMTFAAITFAKLDQKQKFTEILEYIQPIALGIVAYGAYTLSKRVLVSLVSVFFSHRRCDMYTCAAECLCISASNPNWRNGFFCTGYTKGGK